jgi:hypothetical protein
VFAKRIPITDRELAHPHATANLYDLPTACLYGMYRLGAVASVRIRLEELAAAASSLVLFLEHVPSPLLDTLTDPVGQAEVLERQLFEIVGFLRRRELLHLDGHFGNLRADDERVYLVDFGLGVSPRFELSNAERDFVAAHVGHDADYAAMRLVNWLVTTVCGVSASDGPAERNAYVRRCASGEIPRELPASCRTSLHGMPPRQRG